MNMINSSELNEIINNEDAIIQKWDVIERRLTDANSFDKHFYVVTLFYTPSRLDYHKFEFGDLSFWGRKLINGMKIYAGVANRIFWRKHFEGGFRMISVKQIDKQDFPTFLVSFILFSDTDNLDLLLKKNILARVKLINSALSSDIKYLGKGSALRDLFDFRMDLDFSSEPFKKLGREVSNSILKLLNQKIVFLGSLFDVGIKTNQLHDDKHTIAKI